MSGYTFTVGGDFNEILRGFEQLDQRAKQSGQAIGKGIDEGIRETSLRSLSALQARLSRLQQQQTRIAVDSSAFDRVDEQIREVQKLIEAVNRRKITLGADPGSIAALRAQLDGLNAKLGQVAIGSRGFRALQREIQGVERDLRKAGEAGGIAARGIGLVQGAIGLLGGVSVGLAVTQFFRESIQQAIQLETATRRLTNTLGAQGAAGALGFVRGISDELGLSFRDLVTSYGRFTAAATAANVPLGQQQDLFKAVSRAGMALGLSNDEVNGAFLALQQIASKGTVSMEELRQQLGERLPIALAATARGLGLSTKELIKLVETGQLSADRFFPAFTKGLNELTQGAQGVPTAAQNLQRFTNSWQELQVAFGQNLLPGITATVKQLTLAIDELKLQQEGVQLGLSSSLGSLGNDAAGLIGNLRNIREEYNLGDEVYKKTFENAARLARLPQDPVSGAFKIDGEGYERVLGIFEQLAIAYRKQNRDLKGEELQRDAAAKGALQRLEEQAQAQQKLNATAGQRGQISALEAEAALTDRVTASKLSQVDADATLRRAQARTLREEIAGLDELISKLEAARGSGANNQDGILAAQSARAQKVLEIAKLEAQGSRVEVERRQKALTLAETRLDITKQQLALEDRADQVAAARLRAQQQVLDAQLNLQQAQQGLTDSQFGVDRARQQFTLQTAEAELQALRDRGAGVGDIRRQEELIASLKRGATDIDRRALEAQINGAAQRFAIERQVLQLRQAQELIDAQAAQRAAASNVIEQRQRLLSLAGQALDPSLNAGQISAIEKQIVLQRDALALAEQQQRAEAQRVPLLGTIFGLQNQALVAQQQTTANGFRTQAATQGWEQSLAGPLSSLDSAARYTGTVADGVQQIAAGFISANGQTIQFKSQIEGAANNVAGIGNVAQTIDAGFIKANGQVIRFATAIGGIGDSARQAGDSVQDETSEIVTEAKKASDAIFAGFGAGAELAAGIVSGAFENIPSYTQAAAEAAEALAIGYANANTQAEALLTTLRNIATTPQARWAGGPVDPSTAYKVNELGQESLLTPGGLSLINAPARSMWRPPSRGTVLPAGLTARLKDAGAFSRPAATGSGLRLGNLEAEIAALRVEIRGLRQKDWNISIRTPSSASTLRSVGGF